MTSSKGFTIIGRKCKYYIFWWFYSLLFIFQLQFIFNIILYWFRVYSIEARQSYTSQSVRLLFPVPTWHHTYCFGEHTAQWKTKEWTGLEPRATRGLYRGIRLDGEIRVRHHRKSELEGGIRSLWKKVRDREVICIKCQSVLSHNILAQESLCSFIDTVRKAILVPCDSGTVAMAGSSTVSNWFQAIDLLAALCH